MELRSGVLRSFDAGAYRASVTMTGSIITSLHALPVSRSIASAEMVAGRRVAVIFFDPSNPSEAVICAVWT